MIYVTGDTHGNQRLWEICFSSFLEEGDTLIVLGDFGIGFFDNTYRTEEMFYDYISEKNYRILFCDGNHENFEKLNHYNVTMWNGGRVQMIRNNLIHLMRGEVYEIEGKKIFVMGGGYSIDKAIRVPGETWWPDEMPSDEEYQNASENVIIPYVFGRKHWQIKKHQNPHISVIHYSK